MRPVGLTNFKGKIKHFSPSQEQILALLFKDLCLSKREVQITIFTIRGHSNQETAQNFNISEKTVKFHLGRIYRKLNVRNRCQMIWVIPLETLIELHQPEAPTLETDPAQRDIEDDLPSGAW